MFLASPSLLFQGACSMCNISPTFGSFYWPSTLMEQRRPCVCVCEREREIERERARGRESERERERERGRGRERERERGI